MLNGVMGAQVLSGFVPADPKAQAWRAAEQKFERFFRRGQVRRIWSIALRRPRRLLSLTEVDKSIRSRNSYDAGTRTVPVRQIRGSEARYDEFDAAFHPLKRHTQERWLSVASAHLLGTKLPPVRLIQVGGTYFVEDGHHRVSVARALGQQHIEAEVKVRKRD